MHFNEGTSVYNANDEKLGEVSKIVLDPQSKELTHMVVEKGFVFTEDKVLPMSVVGDVEPDKITLLKDAEDLEMYPDFEESHFLAAYEDVPTSTDTRQLAYPLYYYPPVGVWRGGASMFAIPMYVKKTAEKNIPADTVAIDEGTDVVSRDGKQVGDIERIFTDTSIERATHLVISEGLLLKEKKLIPTEWIKDITEDQVQLSVDSRLIDGLPEYQSR